MTQLEGEPPRSFKRMIPLDGNNSMKRMYQVGSHHIRNPCPFIDTDYLLTPEYVDQFANEVASRKHLVAEEDDGDEVYIDEHDDGVSISKCTTNWKAAASDEKKTSWGCFQENGIYVSACRHSLILWFCDMIRSGEL
jgi:hypothetical protein